MQWIPKWMLIFSGAWMALFQCSVVRAADWSVSPGIELTEEYNSNVLFSSQDRISDFTTFIKPRILAAWETERTRLLFNTLVSGEIYVDHSDLDTVSNDTQATLEHHWTPRLHSTFRASFKRDETLEQELEDVGQVTSREERYRYGFQASTTCDLTERLSLEAAAGYSQTTYPDGGLNDQTSIQTSISPSYLLNPRDRVGLRVGVDLVDYEDTATGETFSWLAFWRRDLTETTYFNVGAGYQYSLFDREVIIPRIRFRPGQFPRLVFVHRTLSTDQSGFNLDLSLNQNWTPRFSTVVSAGREQHYDVNGQLVERTYFRGNSTYRITEELSLRCDLGYDLNTQDSPGGTDTSTLRGGGSLSYKLTQDISVRVGGSYDYVVEETASSEDTKDRFRTTVALVCDWPKWLEGY